MVRSAHRGRGSAAGLAVGLAVIGLTACGTGPRDAAVVVEAVGRTGSAPVASRADDASCALVDDATVQLALGDDGAHIAGPEVVGPGTCSWHSGDPTCTMRSLGLQLVRGGDAAPGFARTRLAEVLRSDTTGFGDAAFYSTAVLPAGAGTEIERLEVRQGDTWYRFSVSGRLGNNGRTILAAVASAVLS